MVLIQSMEFRKQYNANELTSTYTAPEVLEKYYVGGVSGYDKEGCPLWIDPFPLLDARGMLVISAVDAVESGTCIESGVCRRPL